MGQKVTLLEDATGNSICGYQESSSGPLFWRCSFARRGAAPSSPTMPTNPMVDKFLDATKIQQEALRGIQMEVDIDAQLPKLKEHGKLKVLQDHLHAWARSPTASWGVSGDNTVKHEVITRYLELEHENAARTHPSPSLRPTTSSGSRPEMTQGDSRDLCFRTDSQEESGGIVQGRDVAGRRHRDAAAGVRHTW